MTPDDHNKGSNTVQGKQLMNSCGMRSNQFTRGNCAAAGRAARETILFLPELPDSTRTTPQVIGTDPTTAAHGSAHAMNGPTLTSSAIAYARDATAFSTPG